MERNFLQFVLTSTVHPLRRIFDFVRRLVATTQGMFAPESKQPTPPCASELEIQLTEVTEVTKRDNASEPADPVPENQLPEIAGPIVKTFVAWLHQQGISGTFDTHEIEYLLYEFASAEGYPLLQKSILFQHLGQQGIRRELNPRKLKQTEWRYRRDIRMGKKRPRVSVYKLGMVEQSDLAA